MSVSSGNWSLTSIPDGTSQLDVFVIVIVHEAMLPKVIGFGVTLFTIETVGTHGTESTITSGGYVVSINSQVVSVSIIRANGGGVTTTGVAAVGVNADTTRVAVTGVVSTGLTIVGPNVASVSVRVAGVTDSGLRIVGANVVSVLLSVSGVVTSGVANNTSKVVSVKDLVGGTSVCGVAIAGAYLFKVNDAFPM
jgi:hypothetical protein